jgi:hypothetical protein
MAHWQMSLVAAAAALAALAGGCDNEASRPLHFKPHVYGGERPSPLTEKRRGDLTERANLQR